MTNSQSIRRLVAGFVRQSEGAYRLAKGVENRTERLRHSVAKLRPGIIKPRPYKIMISLTAQCNARCIGCRYGRDFMPGHQLDWPTIKDLLDDAKQAGFYSIRLYGGEPLLHPDLPKIVAYCVSLGLRPYVTTNASLLDSKIDELVAAGLRDITVGFYGVGDAYDEYVQRPGLYAKVEQGLAAVRDRHGDLVEMQMNWLLMKPTATPEAFHQAREVAERYHMKMRVDLVHYSLPYFQEGAEGELQFTDRDRPQIEAVVAELIQTMEERPALLNHTVEGLRSVTDWLLLGPAMKVPCTAYEMIWVGADGTVQMCYVTFKLGNLKQTRLRDMLNTDQHNQAAQDAFAVKCPNCHCSSNERIMRHTPSLKKYSS
ncbi:MAG: radical SAM protein [Planctomycetota bacterium]|nr:radical SAM protein [Planctomycetota bacterium]